MFQARYDPPHGETAEGFAQEWCVDLIRKAADVPELDVELLSVRPWIMASQIAERWHVGRVFLDGNDIRRALPHRRAESDSIQ